MSTRLDPFLHHPALWRADAQTRVRQPAVPTGCLELDAYLPAGGWPVPALIEVLYESAGIGELKLFVPALAQLGADKAAGFAPTLAWINPPCIPYAPALDAWGLDPSQQLIASALTPAQMLWTMEQALRSQACYAVLGWAERIDLPWLRRLKLAAVEGGCLGILFRPLRYRVQPSPATVRLALSVEMQAPWAVRAQFLKIQGGRPGTVRWQ